MELEQIIGIIAGICTTISIVPQIYKAWTTGDVEDISVNTFLILCVGVGLWTVYGVMKTDWPIIVTNGISTLLNLSLIYLIFTNRGEEDDESKHSDERAAGSGQLATNS